MHNPAARLRAYGSPEEIKVVDTPMPMPRAGEVRVRVLASCIQFTDTVIRRHRYPHAGVRPPFVLGYDRWHRAPMSRDSVTS